MPAEKMSKTAKEIDELFETAMEIEGDISDFVSSLYDQWEKKAFLTEKQISALSNVVETYEDRRR